MIHMGISDHTLVYKCLNVLLPQKKSIVEIKGLKNYNIDHFNSRMSYLLTASSWDKKFQTIYGANKKIFNVSDIHAPLKTRKVIEAHMLRG